MFRINLGNNEIYLSMDYIYFNFKSTNQHRQTNQVLYQVHCCSHKGQQPSIYMKNWCCNRYSFCTPLSKISCTGSFLTKPSSTQPAYLLWLIELTVFCSQTTSPNRRVCEIKLKNRTCY